MVKHSKQHKNNDDFRLTIIWGLAILSVAITVVATYVTPNFTGYIMAGFINTGCFLTLCYVLPKNKNGAMKRINQLPGIYAYGVFICMLALLINLITIMGVVIPPLAKIILN